MWGWTSGRLVGLTAGSLLLLVLWILHERRVKYPLVDLRLLRHRAVLSADVTAVLAGAGMYLLLSLVMRFVQTPASAGYGFGSSVVVAGLVLLPFSIASFTASKVAPVIARRTSPDLVMPLGSVMFFLAMLAFLLVRDSLWQVVVTMTVAGLGVGCTFAAMPGLVVRSVPPEETGSAMSFNQVLRYVGYSAGSALSATVLEAHTSAGSVLPSDGGYGAAALLGCGVWAVTVVVGFVLPRRRAAVRSVDGVEESVLVKESIADAVPPSHTADAVPPPSVPVTVDR
jgi:predicted MFS family arabinose efflux permease